MAFTQTRNPFDQHWKRGTLSDATRVTQGQDPLYPAMALLAMDPLAAFVPQDAAVVDQYVEARIPLWPPQAGDSMAGTVVMPGVAQQGDPPTRVCQRCGRAYP